MEFWIVYQHINNVNGKVYIGITSQSPVKRWNNGRGYIRNQHFYAAIQKYGWQNFQHLILAEGLTKEAAEEMEQRLIAEWDATNPECGYNVANGGNVRGRLSEEAKKRIGEKNSRENIPEERRRKMSEAKLGNNNRGKHIRCVETGEEYKSIVAAAQALHSHRNYISKAAHNPNLTAAGYHWEFC